MQEIINQVEDIISPVYMTGGSVRDMVMHRSPKDYDFSTPLLPQEVEDKVRASGHKAFIVGKRFGTIGFKLDGNKIQVTTFRAEKYKAGSRKPDVSYVNGLQEDLARRDFTINAMAYSGQQIIDPFGGKSDIALRTISAVGDINKRFEEDPLRALRAIRFVADLGFEIEAKTQASILTNSYLLAQVSSERIMSEFDKVLMGPAVDKALPYLIRCDLLTYIFPEFHITESAMDTIATAVAESNEGLAHRWALLLSHTSIGLTSRSKNALAELVARHIALYGRWSNAFQTSVLSELGRISESGE